MRAALLISFLALPACVDAELPVTEGRIATREAFVNTAAGRTVANADTSVTITRDGRITGITHGNTISGTWEWRDGFWCRTITQPVVTDEDCQVWIVEGNRLTVIRDRGTGDTLAFEIVEASAEGAIVP